MSEVEYKISIKASKFSGYQSKKGNQGYVKAFVSNLWKQAMEWHEKEVRFQLFVDSLCYIFIHERFCLERAFQKIRIKGGMCNPCCVCNLAEKVAKYLFDLEIERY